MTHQTLHGSAFEKFLVVRDDVAVRSCRQNLFAIGRPPKISGSVAEFQDLIVEIGSHSIYSGRNICVDTNRLSPIVGDVDNQLERVLLLQARSQDFGREGARFWGSGSITPGKMLKNVHAIWCIILHLLHKIINLENFKVLLFSLVLFEKNIYHCTKTYWKLKCIIIFR